MIYISLFDVATACWCSWVRASPRLYHEGIILHTSPPSAVVRSGSHECELHDAASWLMSAVSQTYCHQAPSRSPASYELLRTPLNMQSLPSAGYYPVSCFICAVEQNRGCSAFPYHLYEYLMTSYRLPSMVPKNKLWLEYCTASFSLFLSFPTLSVHQHPLLPFHPKFWSFAFPFFSALH